MVSKVQGYEKAEKLIEGGMSAGEACKKSGISNATLYKYRNGKPKRKRKRKSSVARSHGGPQLSELKAEVSKLRGVIASQAITIAGLSA